MVKRFTEFTTNAFLQIGDKELLSSYTQAKQIDAYSFIWVRSGSLKITVDHIPYEIQSNTVIVLSPIQYLTVLAVGEVLVYQFNRAFYCIKDHDEQVSCMGLIFFGNSHVPSIPLSTDEEHKFNLLHQVFLEELDTADTIQGEMLRMLTARFIIKLTRLLKETGDSTDNHKTSGLDLLRHFNMLVEQHFKENHSVSFYADKLHKSPKTLSNTFSKLNRSPLQIIHDRIVLETKRQLLYTNKTAKEIAFDLGFDDASHLSRMFKKNTSLSPLTFRKEVKFAF